MQAFEAYEKVLIKSSSNPSNQSFIGKIGVVFGMTPISEFEDGSPDFSEIVDYLLHIEGERVVRRFLPEELESTGEIGKREDYYHDTGIRVGVDEKGRGFLLDKEPRSEEEAARRKEMGWE